MGGSSSVDTPLISIVGLSGSGKTTLMVRLISTFAKEGLRVGTIKHSCHPHPLDAKGKDSWRHKEAGAERTVFVGPKSLQLVADVKDDPSPKALASAYLGDMDLVLVEGFLHSGTEKIEVVRGERSKAPVSTVEDGLVAIATDLPADDFVDYRVPCFDLNDIESIARFITKHLSLAPRKRV